MCILSWLSRIWPVTLRIQEWFFSGCTVSLDSKKTELGRNHQKVFPSACKNTGIVFCATYGSLSQQLLPVVWISRRSLGVICYERLVYPLTTHFIDFDFESNNSVNLSFTFIGGLCPNFAGCQSVFYLYWRSLLQFRWMSIFLLPLLEVCAPISLDVNLSFTFIGGLCPNFAGCQSFFYLYWRSVLQFRWMSIFLLPLLEVCAPISLDVNLSFTFIGGLCSNFVGCQSLFDLYWRSLLQFRWMSICLLPLLEVFAPISLDVNLSFTFIGGLCSNFVGCQSVFYLYWRSVLQFRWMSIFLLTLLEVFAPISLDVNLSFTFIGGLCSNFVGCQSFFYLYWRSLLQFRWMSIFLLPLLEVFAAISLDVNLSLNQSLLILLLHVRKC